MAILEKELRGFKSSLTAPPVDFLQEITAKSIDNLENGRFTEYGSAREALAALKNLMKTTPVTAR